MVPEATQFELTTNVPTVELDILVLELLDIEANGWNRVHCFVQLHLVKDGRLAGGVEPQHQQAHRCV